jgi:hypothetical protein
MSAHTLMKALPKISIRVDHARFCWICSKCVNPDYTLAREFEPRIQWFANLDAVELSPSPSLESGLGEGLERFVLPVKLLKHQPLWPSP